MLKEHPLLLTVLLTYYTITGSIAQISPSSPFHYTVVSPCFPYVSLV